MLWIRGSETFYLEECSSLSIDGRETLSGFGVGARSQPVNRINNNGHLVESLAPSYASVGGSDLPKVVLKMGKHFCRGRDSWRIPLVRKNLI